MDSARRHDSSGSSIGRAPWVIVAAGFHRAGGMDKANAALARYLVARDTPVHLVGHDIDGEFDALPGVTVDRVPKPAGSYMLGEWLLAARGRGVAAAVSARSPGTKTMVNGGNCIWPDINWVHYVHRAWLGSDAGAPTWFKIKGRTQAALARLRERTSISRARVVIANSERTRRDLISLLGICPERIHTVYFGADPDCRPASPVGRKVARDWLRIDPWRPMVAFVGALGYDSRKGFDVLWSAWRMLCADPEWDAHLVVAGAGRGSERWFRAVRASEVANRVTMLGFTTRIDDLLAAADLLVSPSRYEAYGLNVHEALCHGVPAMVTASAGVAEQYPLELRELLIDDPEDARGLAARMRAWRGRIPSWKERVAPLSVVLGKRTWDDMAREIVAIAAEAPIAQYERSAGPVQDFSVS